METTAYSVLGIARDATEEQISAAYKARAREHHPDHGGDAAKMARLNKAWEKLRSTEARETYDRHLVELERAGRVAPAGAETSSDQTVEGFIEQLKRGADSGADVGNLIAGLGRQAGVDEAGCQRIQAAAAQGARIGKDVVDLVGLIRGQQR